MSRYSLAPGPPPTLHIAQKANAAKQIRPVKFNHRLSGVESAASSLNMFIPALPKRAAQSVDGRPSKRTALATCEPLHTKPKFSPVADLLFVSRLLAQDLNPKREPHCCMPPGRYPVTGIVEIANLFSPERNFCSRAYRRSTLCRAKPWAPHLSGKRWSL